MPSDILIFDLEANGLLEQATLIHTCAYAYGTQPGKPGVALATPRATSPSAFAALLMQAGSIVGHNIIRYDLPLLQKLGYIPAYYIKRDMLYWPDGSTCRVLDTLLLSQLTQGHPYDRFSHGLDAWGQRLGQQKLAVSDWHGSGQAVYDARCIQDVVITQALWGYLSRRAEVTKVLGKGYLIECQFADIISKQVANGITFDIPLAEETCAAITARMQVIADSVIHLLPTTTPTKGEYDKARIPVKRFNPDGAINGQFKNWLKHRGLDLNSTNTAILDSTGVQVAALAIATHIEINKQLTLDNDAGVKDYLLTKGWEPEYWNYKKDGNGDTVKGLDGTKVQAAPKIRQGTAICTSLQGLMLNDPDLGLVVKAYLAYGVYAHRLSSLQGMLKQPRLKVDGKLGADMQTVGAATGRVTHSVVANIPKSLNDFDTELLCGANNVMRACFKAPDGYVMVGYDAAALEARVEAHRVHPYAGGLSYGATLLGVKPNDIHSLNAAHLGVVRDAAKAIKYALGYGAGIGKVQALLRCDSGRAAEVFEQYWVKAACVKDLQADLIKEWRLNKQQYITCIDGSRLYLGSKHLLLNYDFQSTGTKLMKLTTVLLDNQLRKQGLYTDNLVMKLIDYHDEGQLAVKADVPGLADYVGKLAVACVVQAGVMYNLNVPLDGDYLIGPNWGATH